MTNELVAEDEAQAELAAAAAKGELDRAESGAADANATLERHSGELEQAEAAVSAALKGRAEGRDRAAQRAPADGGI